MTLLRFSLVIQLILLSSLAYPEQDRNSFLTAIHSPEVQQIMRNLHALLFERERSNLETQRLRSEQLELLVEQAESLSSIAASSALIDSLQQLDVEEQARFRELANELSLTAKTISEENTAGHYSEVDAGYLKLQETCNQCHQLFRDW